MKLEEYPWKMLKGELYGESFDIIREPDLEDSDKLVMISKSYSGKLLTIVSDIIPKTSNFRE
jgi:hypothetical protein